MESLPWIAAHWFDLIQTVGIIGGFCFTAYTIRKDELARKIGNSIAINEQHRQIWKDLYSNPQLLRVLDKELNLEERPVSDQETLFTKAVIIHLSTAYRAMKHGEFVKLQGLGKDVKNFFSLPIPKAVWKKIKVFHDEDFVSFIDLVLEERA